MMWMWLVKCARATSAITFASRLIPAFAGKAICSLVDDIGAQNPDAGNLDFDLVAVLHPQRRLAAGADPVGCAGGDDIARLQPGHGREIFDDGGDVEDHVIGRVVLHDGAIQPRREFEPLGVGDDVRRHQPRAERPGGGEILAGRRRMLLEVAHAAVEEAGVAGGGRKLAHRLGRDGFAQAWPARRQVDNATVRDRAELGHARLAKTDQTHEATMSNEDGIVIPSAQASSFANAGDRPTLSTAAGDGPPFPGFWRARVSAREMAQATPSSKAEPPRGFR